MLFREYRGLPRPVYVLFVARIINRMGDFVAMFLALFLTRYLGMTSARAGAVITLVILASVAGGLAGGRLSDMRGRKKILLGAMVSSALFLGAGGFTTHRVLLPALLVLSQFFLGAMRPVNTALLVDSVETEDRQRAFSLLYLGINLGVAVGPLLAGFLFANYRSWIFWGDALTTLFAAVLVMRWVPETRGEERRAPGLREQEVAGSSFRAFFGRPLLVAYALCILGNNFVYGQHSFTLPLLLQELFSQAGARYYGILMSANAVAVLLFTPPALTSAEASDAGLQSGGRGPVLHSGLRHDRLDPRPYRLVSGLDCSLDLGGDHSGGQLRGIRRLTDSRKPPRPFQWYTADAAQRRSLPLSRRFRIPACGTGLPVHLGFHRNSGPDADRGAGRHRRMGCPHYPAGGRGVSFRVANAPPYLAAF